jgi:hypothetical protein
MLREDLEKPAQQLSGSAASDFSHESWTSRKRQDTPDLGRAPASEDFMNRGGDLIIRAGDGADGQDGGNVVVRALLRRADP